MHWGAVYGSAALVVAVLSRTGPQRNVRLFSVVLLLCWGVSNVVDRRVDLIDGVEISALMDAVCMSLALNAMFQNFRRWKAALVLCFSLQLLTHIALMFLPESRTSQYQYKLVLNLLFIAELVSVAAPTAVFHLRQLRGRLRHRPVAAEAAQTSRQACATEG
jgi:hypothetical protein